MRVMFLFYLKEKVSFLITKNRLSNLQCNDSGSSIQIVDAATNVILEIDLLEILQNIFRFYDE